jgi:hypothetical protein
LNDGTHDNLQNRGFTEPDQKFISWTYVKSWQVGLQHQRLGSWGHFLRH